MSNGFAVNSERLRDSGGQVRRLAGQLDNQQGAMNSQVAGLPAVWGADEEGAAFGGGYQELTAKLAELLEAMSKAFDTVGANLETMADNVDAADRGAASVIQGVQRLLDGP